MENRALGGVCSGVGTARLNRKICPCQSKAQDINESFRRHEGNLSLKVTSERALQSFMNYLLLVGTSVCSPRLDEIQNFFMEAVLDSPSKAPHPEKQGQSSGYVFYSSRDGVRDQDLGGAHQSLGQCPKAQIYFGPISEVSVCAQLAPLLGG